MILKLDDNEGPKVNFFPNSMCSLIKLGLVGLVALLLQKKVHLGPSRCRWISKSFLGWNTKYNASLILQNRGTFGPKAILLPVLTDEVYG